MCIWPMGTKQISILRNKSTGYCPTKSIISGSSRILWPPNSRRAICAQQILHLFLSSSRRTISRMVPTAEKTSKGWSLLSIALQWEKRAAHVIDSSPIRSFHRSYCTEGSPAHTHNAQRKSYAVTTTKYMVTPLLQSSSVGTHRGKMIKPADGDSTTKASCGPTK